MPRNRWSGLTVILGVLALCPPLQAKARSKESRAAQVPNTVFLEELTSDELARAIAAGKHLVIIISGGTEGSGPHLVLGKHNLRVRHLAERIARKLGCALVAPILPIAPTGESLMKYPGSINLQAATFSKVNRDLAESLIRAGFRQVVLMGDHAGSQEPLAHLAEDLDALHRSQGVRVFFSSDAYAKSQTQMQAYLEGHGYPPSRHAGVFDTSQSWALDARAVRPERLAMGDPWPAAAMGPKGVEGDPRRASKALGNLFNQWTVDNAVAEIRRFLAEPNPVIAPTIKEQP